MNHARASVLAGGALTADMDDRKPACSFTASARCSQRRYACRVLPPVLVRITWNRLFMLVPHFLCELLC
jgi:hypothetical protein